MSLSRSLWPPDFWSRQLSIIGSISWASQAVKHAKVRGLPHWFSDPVRGSLAGLKVWKGQVYRGLAFVGRL
ncbi:hypothetical protein [Vibrio parahaemolyticus]|uniref:hypothetical protein n=1 Tax=Vibrio parahaemolyticus TaxID=670 RepID=UPI00040CAA48|nr:hypothetical protein [Vibrio parahaemolyticus]